MDIFIKENSWLARIAARKLAVSSVAIVFGRTIHLHNTTKENFLADKKWLCHEIKHVEQYNRLGYFRFLALYLLESIRSGYYKNRFEVEARNSEHDLSLLKNIKLHDK